MAKLARSIAMAAIVFGMPTAAYAQTAASPHLHAPPPATAVQPAPAQPHQKTDHQEKCQCPCCQMMQKMEKQSGDADCMQKMIMMQGRDAPQPLVSPEDHDKG
jgi:hypothetical protein